MAVGFAISKSRDLLFDRDLELFPIILFIRTLCDNHILFFLLLLQSWHLLNLCFLLPSGKMSFFSNFRIIHFSTFAA